MSSTVSTSLRLAALVVLGALLAVAAPRPAQAALPGDNGDIAFVRYTTLNVIEEIFSVGPQGGVPTQLTFSPAVSDITPAWSPDGTRVAFARSAPFSGLWTMNPDGSGLAAIPNTAGGTFPTWSPTGDRLAFARHDGNDTELFVIGADGTGLTQITNNRVDDWAPSWSPKGNEIAFTRTAPGGDGSALFAVRPDGSAQRQITPYGTWDSYPDYSPDGKWIAFARFLPAQGNRIFKVRADGSQTTQLTFNSVNDSQPAWSPEGDRIVFSRGGEEADPAHLFTIHPSGKKLTQITFGRSNRDISPAWQPL